MKKVNEMSYIELIEEVEKLRCERDMYKNLNRTHVEKVNILTHEVDHYKDMVDMKKKQITRMTYRIEELENENETLNYYLNETVKRTTISRNFAMIIYLTIWQRLETTVTAF